MNLEFNTWYETKHGDGVLIGRSPNGDLLMSFEEYDGKRFVPCASRWVLPSDILGPKDVKKPRRNIRKDGAGISRDVPLREGREAPAND